MKLLEQQGWHLLLLAVLLVGLYLIVCSDPKFLLGSLWPFHTDGWLIGAILVPVAHQLYVVCLWRWELYNKGLTRTFGGKGFRYFKAGFAVLILLRPVTITLLSISNAGTLDLLPGVGYALGILALLPGAYLFYSIKRYFGIDRAFGIDHFQPETYRDVPMVRKGIFKYSPNAMYVFGFLVLWAPGLLCLSKAGLLAALFNHLYIWVHYFFTERPDMNRIYGPGRD